MTVADYEQRERERNWDHKICNTCGVSKTKNDHHFYKTGIRYGQQGQEWINFWNTCITCARQKKKELRVKRNPVEYYSKTMYANAKSRSRKHYWPFDITIGDVAKCLKDRKRCPACGCIFHDYSADDCARTIDKKIPSSGYVKGNIDIICMGCNRAKGELTIDRIDAIREYMLS